MTSTHCEPVYINSHTMDGSELQSLEHAQRQRLLSDSEQEAPRSTSYLSSSDAVDHSAEPPNHPGSLNFDFEPTALNSLSASLKQQEIEQAPKGPASPQLRSFPRTRLSRPGELCVKNFWNGEPRSFRARFPPSF